MKLDLATVEHIAKLARISLTEEEKEMYQKQLSSIFDYVKMLDEVDTTDVKETCQVTGLEDVFRSDEVEEKSEEEKQKIIKAFPESFGRFLKVKKVF